MIRQQDRRGKRLIGTVTLAAAALSACTVTAKPNPPGSSSTAPPPPPEKQPAFSAQVPQDADAPVRAPSHAAVAGDVVVVNAHNAVIAFDADSGETLWSREDVPDPFVVDGAVVSVETKTGGHDQSVTIVDAATGEDRAKIAPDDGNAVDTRYAVTSEAVLVADCEDRRAPCELSAHSLRDGDVTWRLQLPHTGAETGSPFKRSDRAFALPERPRRNHGPGRDAELTGDVAEPMAAPFVRYVAVRGGLSEQGDDGSAVPVVTVDVRTGKVVRRWSTDGLRTERTGGFTDVERLHVTDGKVLIDAPTSRNDDPMTTGFDVRAGKRLWRAPVVAGERAPVLAETAAGPVLLEESGDHQPQLIELATGKARWSGPRGARLLGIADNLAVTADSGNGELAGHDATSGQQQWKTRIVATDRTETGRRQSGVGQNRWAVAGEQLSIATPTLNSTELRVYDLATGELQWGSAGNTLLGAGDGWVLTSERQDSGFTVRLFR